MIKWQNESKTGREREDNISRERETTALIIWKLSQLLRDLGPNPRVSSECWITYYHSKLKLKYNFTLVVCCWLVVRNLLTNIVNNSSLEELIEMSEMSGLQYCKEMLSCDDSQFLSIGLHFLRNKHFVLYVKWQHESQEKQMLRNI